MERSDHADLAEQIGVAFPRVPVAVAEDIVAGKHAENATIVDRLEEYSDGVRPIPLEAITYFQDSLPSFSVAGLQLVLGQFLLAALALPKDSAVGEFVIYRLAHAGRGDIESCARLGWFSEVQRNVLCAFLCEYAEQNDYDPAAVADARRFVCDEV